MLNSYEPLILSESAIVAFNSSAKVASILTSYIVHTYTDTI